MLTTDNMTDFYRDHYDRACHRGNIRAFALGWAQGNIASCITTVDTILKTKMKQADKVSAIRAEMRNLERLLKEMENPEALYEGRGRA